MEERLAPLNVLKLFFPDRALALCEYVMLQEKELNIFPEWRVQQFVKFIGQLISNVDEMKTACEQKRIMRLAWAGRNLLELSIWIDYCNLSPENAERFHKDSARDAIDWANTIQKIVSGGAGGTNIPELELSMKNLADRFSLGGVDKDWEKIQNAAQELGRKDSFTAYNKLFSKFAHPTAWALSSVLETAIEADEDLRSMFLRDGVGFAINALTNIWKELMKSLEESPNAASEIENLTRWNQTNIQSSPNRGGLEDRAPNISLIAT